MRPAFRQSSARNGCGRPVGGRRMDVQGFPERPGLRAFRCAGRIVAGLLIFLTTGLIGCYAMFGEAIKLCDAQAETGGSSIISLLQSERLKKRHRSAFCWTFPNFPNTSVIRRSVEPRQL